MNLEASVKSFWSELRKPARKDNFMCYDRAPYSRHPTSRHGGAFKAGWRAAQEFLDSRRDPYRPATMRRLAWCNLGYRFVRWQHDEGRKLGDRDAAYELFEEIAQPEDARARRGVSSSHLMHAV